MAARRSALLGLVVVLGAVSVGVAEAATGRPSSNGKATTIWISII